MSAPSIYGKALTSSAILTAVGSDLLKIKMEDNLRWNDIGEVLGKSEDQAAKYADGSAAMDIVAFARGKAAWNGRFSGSLDKLVDRAAGDIDGQHSQTLILRAAVSLSSALEDGGLTDEEIRTNRKTLEDAKAAIDKLLCRLKPMGALA